MTNLWMLALAISLGLLAVALVVSSLLWRRRWVWLRRIVSVVLLVSSVVVGLVAWNVNAPPSFINRPAPLAASALVFAATSDTTITAFQAATGKTAWSYTQPGVVISDIRQYQQLLVVVSDVTTNIYTALPKGTLLTGLDATSGHVRWQSNMRDFSLFQAMNGLGVSVYQGLLYLAGEAIVNGAPTSPALLLAVDMTTGHMLWQETDRAPFDGTDDWMPKLASDTNALYVDVAYSIQAFGAHDGVSRWVWSSTGSEIVGVFADGGLVFGVTRSQQTFALDAATGALAWKRTLGSLNFAPTRVVVQGATVFISATDNGRLSVYALVATTGAQLWRRDMGVSGSSDSIGNIYSGMGQYLVSAPSAIIVNAGDGLHALKNTTGADVWRLAPTPTLFFEGETGGGEWTHPAHARIAPTALGDVLYLQAIEGIPPAGFFGSGRAHDRVYLYAVSALTGQPYWRVQRAADFPVYPHFVL